MNKNIENLQQESLIPNNDTPLLDVHKFIHLLITRSITYLHEEAEKRKDFIKNPMTILIKDPDLTEYMGLVRAATALQAADITVTSTVENLRSIPIETLSKKIIEQCAGVLEDEANKCRREKSPTSENVATSIESGISLIESYFLSKPSIEAENNFINLNNIPKYK